MHDPVNRASEGGSHDNQIDSSILEDEALIALAMIDVMEKAGFQVEHVADGNAALARLKANSSALAALVTDVRLPGGINAH